MAISSPRHRFLSRSRTCQGLRVCVQVQHEPVSAWPDASAVFLSVATRRGMYIRPACRACGMMLDKKKSRCDDYHSPTVSFLRRLSVYTTARAHAHWANRTTLWMAVEATTRLDCVNTSSLPDRRILVAPVQGDRVWRTMGRRRHDDIQTSGTHPGSVAGRLRTIIPRDDF